MGWKAGNDLGARSFFPPKVVVEVKVLACSLPSERGIPLSRFSNEEIAREVIERGITASISDTTVWRWLHEEAIRPWYHRSWIFPKDPCFSQKASIILDLYHRVWEGKALGKHDYVISADEKTSIQARARIHPSAPPGSRRPMRIEHHYKRQGAFVYLAAWDVARAKIFGHCTTHKGIKSFRRLVDLVMRQEPYRSARRVFWIVDNDSSHRGQTAAKRLASWYPNAIMVHTPVHASWLNQIEIYFSIVQRKVLSPSSAECISQLQARLFRFQARYQRISHPFEWKFSKKDLKQLFRSLALKRIR